MYFSFAIFGVFKDLLLREYLMQKNIKIEFYHLIFYFILFFANHFNVKLLRSNKQLQNNSK